MNQLNFGARLGLAFTLPWRILLNGAFAARVDALDSSPALEDEPQALPAPEAPPEAPEPQRPPEPQQPPEPPVPEIAAEADTTAALQLLAILQREGRFVDFLREDVSGFSDAEIGAAARVVHEGCKRGLEQYTELAPIRSEREGDTVTLEPGYNASETRVTGHVVGAPPFRGTLAHHGWRVATMTLPTLSKDHDPSVVAPAEVEV